MLYLSVCLCAWLAVCLCACVVCVGVLCVWLICYVLIRIILIFHYYLTLHDTIEKAGEFSLGIEIYERVRHSKLKYNTRYNTQHHTTHTQPH